MKNLRFHFGEIISVSLVLALLSLIACRTDNVRPVAEEDRHILTCKDYDPEGGAGRGDNPNSVYYVNPDYYFLKADRMRC